MQVHKECPYAMVEAVEPFKLNPTSITNSYQVFEHLLLWWMGTYIYSYYQKCSPIFGRVGFYPG